MHGLRRMTRLATRTSRRKMALSEARLLADVVNRAAYTGEGA
jgi:hypothetical protein